MDDLISRQKLFDELNDRGIAYNPEINMAINSIPSERLERQNGEWSTEEVAELLSNMFGEECACNFNGIDEWLPERCEYAETTCPDPEEKHGCWMQFLLQGGVERCNNG